MTAARNAPQPANSPRHPGCIAAAAVRISPHLAQWEV